MTITETDRSQAAANAEELSGRLFMTGLGALELLSVELGLRLGCYRALREDEGRTSAELADTTGLAERYVREWLEQQAVSGFVQVDDPDRRAPERRYSLRAGTAAVLLDPDNPANTTPLASFLAEAGRMIPSVADAFRTGGGVPYEAYGVQHIQAAFTRPVFTGALVQEWLPALPDIHRRLVAGDTVRIVDVGCGEGVAAVTIASVYPRVQVTGYDLDDTSIAAARALARDSGVSDRVSFEVWDAATGAASAPVPGPFDLVMAIEMLHDAADPVGILSTMRALRAPGGEVVVADERVADHFTAPGDEMERFMYVASVLHCLPAGMSEPGSAATGTVLRTDGVRAYAACAGFSSTEVLPVEHPQFRLYRLVD